MFENADVAPDTPLVFIVDAAVVRDVDPDNDEVVYAPAESIEPMYDIVAPIETLRLVAPPDDTETDCAIPKLNVFDQIDSSRVLFVPTPKV